MNYSADRNLLFGLLALQNGLIDQGQLVAAFQAWSGDQTRPLAEHFVARGVLGADECSGVETMLVLYIKKHGNDVGKALAAVPLARSIRESLPAFTERLLADDVERSMAGEPVTASTERPFDRLGQWLRRHRTWAYAALVCLVGVCLVAVIPAALYESSRRREAAARRTAEQSFRMAHDAVDRYVSNVIANTALKEPDSINSRTCARNCWPARSITIRNSSSVAAATLASALTWPALTSASVKSPRRSHQPGRRSSRSARPRISGNT